MKYATVTAATLTTTPIEEIPMTSRTRLLLLIAALAITAFAWSAQASATDDLQFNGSVGAETNYLYRGANLSSDDDLSLNATARFDNVLIPGLYFRTGLNTTSYNDWSTKTRSDTGIGYTRDLGKWTYDVSLNHVANPGTYGYDYNEARGRLGYNVTTNIQLFGDVGYQLGDNSENDLYVAAGVDYFNAFGVDNLRVGALVSGIKYDDPTNLGSLPVPGSTVTYVDHSRFNNAEGYVSYLFNDKWSAYGKYSVGGHTQFGEIDNESTIGVRLFF
jgi:hypothetical protein